MNANLALLKNVRLKPEYGDAFDIEYIVSYLDNAKSLCIEWLKDNVSRIYGGWLPLEEDLDSVHVQGLLVKDDCLFVLTGNVLTRQQEIDEDFPIAKLYSILKMIKMKR